MSRHITNLAHALGSTARFDCKVEDDNGNLRYRTVMTVGERKWEGVGRSKKISRKPPLSDCDDSWGENMGGCGSVQKDITETSVIGLW